MADFSKIGKNNKNRGRAFERQVAEKLGWTRVPYSGAIKEWGGADVVDGFYTRDGYWAAECKTQQPGPKWSISIKHKWVAQMLGGESNGRHGVIIVKNVGQIYVGAGSRAYVVLPEDSYDFMLMRNQRAEVSNAFSRFSSSTFTRGKGHNFVVEPAFLELADSDYIVELAVEDKSSGEDTTWFVMSLDSFARFLKDARPALFVPEIKPT